MAAVDGAGLAVAVAEERLAVDEVDVTVAGGDGLVVGFLDDVAALAVGRVGLVAPDVAL